MLTDGETYVHAVDAHTHPPTQSHRAKRNLREAQVGVLGKEKVKCAVCKM